MQQLICIRKNSDLNYIGRCLGYFSGDKPAIVVLFIAIALSMAAGILQAWPLAVLVDSVVAPNDPQDWLHHLFLAWLPKTPTGQIAGLAAIALVLRVLQEVFAAAQKLLQTRLSYTGVLQMRCDLYRKLQIMHLDFHRSRPLGDTIFRLTWETFGCQTVFNVLIGITFAAVRITVMLALLCSRNLTLTWLALLMVPPLIWANLVFSRKIKERNLESRETDTAFMSSVHRAMNVIGLTQAFGREEYEYNRFGSAARNCIRSWTRIHRQEVSYGISVGIILGLGGALILGYGGYLIQQHSLTPGDLIIFTTYLSMMYDPLCQLTGAQLNLQSGLTSAKRVFDMLDQNAMVYDTPGALPLSVQPRTLRLNAISFHYSPQTPVLKDISLSIPPGTSVGLFGASGVGKSTLLNLLPRFYDPTEGTITLDGHDLREIRLKDLRRHMAFALQDAVILPTTVWENIAYGRPSATEADIREAARLAGAADFIENLPGGYQTQLNESGHNLSGGQRQRIAIARALLTEAPILILDEPTSAQDAHHEELLRQTLLQLRHERTIVVVSHRISTIKHCDLISVLDDGRIKEAGSHDELMRIKGVYYTTSCLGPGIHHDPGQNATARKLSQTNIASAELQS
jgi:ATP-binding cassette, subfamily B, bacterial